MFLSKLTSLWQCSRGILIVTRRSTTGLLTGSQRYCIISGSKSISFSEIVNILSNIVGQRWEIIGPEHVKDRELISKWSGPWLHWLPTICWSSLFHYFAEQVPRTRVLFYVHLIHLSSALINIFIMYCTYMYFRLPLNSCRLMLFACRLCGKI